jgi:hypothetical protein
MCHVRCGVPDAQQPEGPHRRRTSPPAAIRGSGQGVTRIPASRNRCEGGGHSPPPSWSLQNRAGSSSDVRRQPVGQSNSTGRGTRSPAVRDGGVAQPTAARAPQRGHHSQVTKSLSGSFLPSAIVVGGSSHRRPRRGTCPDSPTGGSVRAARELDVHPESRGRPAQRSRQGDAHAERCSRRPWWSRGRQVHVLGGACGG